MVRAARLVISALGLGLCACAGTGEVPGEFARAAALVDRGCRLEVRGGRTVAAVAPVAEAELPAAVARMLAMVMPGGAVAECGQVWRDGTTTFQIVKVYPEGTPGRHRTLTLAPDGAVLERSHEIAWLEVDARVRADIEALGLGDVVRAEAVQGAPGDEEYRVTLARAGGRWVVRCRRGGLPRVQRVVGAELWIG